MNLTKSRSSRFFQLEAAAYIGNILSYVTSSVLTDADPWIPILLGLLLLLLAGVLLLVTARSIKVDRRETQEETTIPPGENEQENQDLVDNVEVTSSGKKRWEYISSFFALVRQRKVILILLAGYWLRMLAVSVTGLQLIYVSWLFEWSYSKVRLLVGEMCHKAGLRRSIGCIHRLPRQRSPLDSVVSPARRRCTSHVALFSQQLCPGLVAGTS